MDSITHIVFGAAIGEAIMGKQIGKRAMLWGAMAASLPDIDVVFTPFFTGIDRLLVHRGITHSIFFMLIISPLLGILFSKIKFKRQVDWKRWNILFLLGIGSHLLIDSFTAYGTGWFEPFSNYRVTFNNIFVADPFYTIALLISFFALSVLKPDSPKRKIWNMSGLIISSLYLVYTFYNKWNVDSVFEKSLQTQNIPYTRYFTTPTPLNNFLWMLVAEEKEGYKIGYYSVFDTKEDISFQSVPRNQSLLDSFSQSTEIQKLKLFSDNYYSVAKTDSGLFFYDLRFGKGAGWDDETTPFFFSYRLDRHGKFKALDRGRLKGTLAENLEKLIERMKGN